MPAKKMTNKWLYPNCAQREHKRRRRGSAPAFPGRGSEVRERTCEPAAKSVDQLPGSRYATDAITPGPTKAAWRLRAFVAFLTTDSREEGKGEPASRSEGVREGPCEVEACWQAFRGPGEGERELFPPPARSRSDPSFPTTPSSPPSSRPASRDLASTSGTCSESASSISSPAARVSASECPEMTAGLRSRWSLSSWFGSVRVSGVEGVS